MSFRKFLFLCLLMLIVGRATAQYGCTDYQATNFDPSAVISDGSCTYLSTTMPVPVKCDVNPFQLAETSGLVNNGNDFWSHVDNTDNSIYRIDTASTTIFQQIIIQNAGNQDWEDITSDNNYIYIGDIGNNGGGRTNLCFYRIAKSSIHVSTSWLNAGKIRFSYSDQVVFNIQNGSYYDCEAFFVLRDTIHMFTKGWTNLWTKHYVLSTDTGIQVAQLVDSFNVNGVVTSAAIQGDSLVVLLGLNYTGALESFIWAFSKFHGSDFFSGNKRRFEIGDLNTTGQSEAICFSGTKKGFITNEKLPATPAQIREFDLNPYMPDKPNAMATAIVSNNALSLKACGDVGTISFTIKNSTLAGGADLYLSNGLQPIFASVPLLNDTLTVGDSTTITVTLNSGTLSAGTYTEDIVIVTNDPFNTLLQIPIILHVDSNICMNYMYDSDTCTGVTNFTATPINNPTSYYWDFGDGNTSTDVNPSHSYAADGNYTVMLIGCNGSGCDTIFQNVAVVISGPIAPTCYPQTQAYCCRSGIVHFRIFGPVGDIINNVSNDASVGYENFSCTTPETIITDFPYTLACTTGDTIIETLKVWLDLNNDGILDPVAEEIFSDTNALSYIHTGSIVIPSLPGNVYGFPLRLRVSSDYNSIPAPCQDPVYGQHEDYSVVLSLSTKVNDLSIETGFLIYPNPFADETTFNYLLKKSSLVTMEIYNVVGERVETIVNSEMQASGNYTYKITGNTPGIYFVKLTVNNESITERIMKL